MGRRQGALAGNLEGDHPGPAILSEHFQPFAPEKGMGDALVELGTMREVLIEAPNQSLARKRQVNLSFTIPRLFARPMLPKDWSSELFTSDHRGWWDRALLSRALRLWWSKGLSPSARTDSSSVSVRREP